MANDDNNNNPSLRRSVSDPRLSRHRRRRRTFSTTSSKSSWSSKLAKILARLALFSSDSELTEESLEAHNKRIREELEQRQLHDKTPKSSPYYRGLTDSSLAINYHHGPLATPGPAHQQLGGPHYASSSATQVTSFSSIVVSKLKGWAPCLGKSNDKPAPGPDKNNNNNSIIQNIPTVTKTASSSSSKPKPRSKPRPKPEPDPEPEPVRRSEEALNISNDDGDHQEKLLRERSLQSRRGGGGGEVAEKERYTWGDKYRPKVLEEFICNRRKARQLKEVVREKGCGNYIFEGPPGVGKRTMIRAMLREAFGHQAMEVYCIISMTYHTSNPSLSINFPIYI